MRLVIAAVGRLKDGPERDLFDRYQSRVDASGRSLGLGPLKVVEIPESRAADTAARKAEEAERLLAKAGSDVARVVLDETGKQLSSEAFAKFMQGERAKGIGALAFLIGGPDGHGAKAVDGAVLKLSLGAMTLPHMMARIILAEQIYRAATILTGHPYHRS